MRIRDIWKRCESSILAYTVVVIQTEGIHENNKRITK